MKFDSNFAYSCKHKPTNEDWWIIAINLEQGLVYPAGWPPSSGKLSDCTNWKKERELNEEEIQARDAMTTWTESIPYQCIHAESIGETDVIIKPDSEGKLYWHLINQTPDVNSFELLFAMQQAFGVWQEVLPVTFEPTKDISKADFFLYFSPKESHIEAVGCPFDFDGKGKVLAHAFYPNTRFKGHIHFDDAELFGMDGQLERVHLATVAAHEIGHALGIPHTDIPDNLMNPFYNGRRLHLGGWEIDFVQGLYRDYFDIPGDDDETDFPPIGDGCADKTAMIAIVIISMVGYAINELGTYIINCI